MTTSINTPQLRGHISEMLWEKLSGRVHGDDIAEAAAAVFVLLDEASALEQQPRVWFDGEDIQAGTHVLAQTGMVHLVGEDEPPGYPCGMIGFGPLVEVILPDHAAAVAREEAERAETTR